MGSKKKMLGISRKRRLFAIVLFVMLFLVVFSSLRQSHSGSNNIADKTKSPSKVCFNTTCINVEIADTPDLRSKGLMFRESLDEDKGMLFIFGSEGYWGFWMKNTIISLDIIWIDKDMKIIHIQTAQPYKEEFCITYYPQRAAKYVLEVNAGFAGKNNLSLGDEVSLF